MINPHKNIVRGVLISMIITAVIYVMLQVAFIGAIDPNLLAQKGWHGINYTSPFADIAILLGMNWLAILLYGCFCFTIWDRGCVRGDCLTSIGSNDSYRTFAPMVGTVRTALHDSAVCNGCGSDFSSGNG